MNVDEVIDHAVCVRGQFSVREIYLFGSRAKGTALARSDIDIAVTGIHCDWRISKNMDAKFTKRFESFRRFLASLVKAGERDMKDTFILSDTGAEFCNTFKLAWKVTKDLLIQYYEMRGFISGSPREVLRTAFKAKMISDERWYQMLLVRNDLAHDYDGGVIREHCGAIICVYLDLFYELQKKQSCF